MISNIFVGILIMILAFIIICGAVIKFADNKYVGGTLLSVLAYVVLIFSLVVVRQLGVGDTEIMYKEKIPTIEIQLAEYDLEKARLKVIALEEYIDN